MTSHPTRATRRCAARCGRIDLIPSRRIAALWIAWLAIVCLVFLAMALPLSARLAMCLGLCAANLRALASLVLLRGPRAVRWIEWDLDGQFRLGAALDESAREASLHRGSFRLGFAFLVLWFSTPAGLRGVLIDGGLQDPVAFRRLGRSLNRRPERPSGHPGGGKLIASRLKV